MIMKKNYGASHDPFVVSSKRIELSPYLNKYYIKILFSVFLQRDFIHYPPK